MKSVVTVYLQLKRNHGKDGKHGKDGSTICLVKKKEPRNKRKGRKRWEHDRSGEENGTTEGTERTEEMKISL